MENYYRVKAAEAIEIAIQQADQVNFQEGIKILEKEIEKID